MAKSDEDERRERLELLKLKQGLISESELIPEEQEKPVPAPLTARQKAANFFYYYKWIILISVIGIALVTYFIVKLATQVKPDIKVLMIGIESGSEIPVRTEQARLALEQYCPDFNGDGKSSVGITPIDLGANSTQGEYYMAQLSLFDLELTGEGCIIISEESFFDYVLENAGMKPEDFLPIGDGYSAPVSETALWEALGEFPENTYLYFLKKDREETVLEKSETVLNALLAY